MPTEFQIRRLRNTVVCPFDEASRLIERLLDDGHIEDHQAANLRSINACLSCLEDLSEFSVPPERQSDELGAQLATQAAEHKAVPAASPPAATTPRTKVEAAQSPQQDAGTSHAVSSRWAVSPPAAELAASFEELKAWNEGMHKADADERKRKAKEEADNPKLAERAQKKREQNKAYREKKKKEKQQAQSAQAGASNAVNVKSEA